MRRLFVTGVLIVGSCNRAPVESEPGRTPGEIGGSPSFVDEQRSAPSLSDAQVLEHLVALERPSYTPIARYTPEPLDIATDAELLPTHPLFDEPPVEPQAPRISGYAGSCEELYYADGAPTALIGASYEQGRQLLRWEDSDADGHHELVVRLSYDDASRITEVVTENRWLQGEPCNWRRDVETFEYDERGRLTRYLFWGPTGYQVREFARQYDEGGRLRWLFEWRERDTVDMGRQARRLYASSQLMWADKRPVRLEVTRHVPEPSPTLIREATWYGDTYVRIDSFSTYPAWQGAEVLSVVGEQWVLRATLDDAGNAGVQLSSTSELLPDGYVRIFRDEKGDPKSRVSYYEDGFHSGSVREPTGEWSRVEQRQLEAGHYRTGSDDNGMSVRFDCSLEAPAFRPFPSEAECPGGNAAPTRNFPQ